MMVRRTTSYCFKTGKITRWDYPWREKTPEEIVADRAAEPDPYRKNHLSALLHRRRRMLAAERGTHTDAEWEALLAERGNRCDRCGAGPSPRRPLIRSRIVPPEQGGSDLISNLVPLCHRCHSQKPADS